jgi:DNA-binding response OmpR family regulator
MNKLLILDSSDDQSSALKYFLEKKQYAVRTLNNAFNLFSEIYFYKPDLLLLDAFFKGVDGRELCKELRSRPETKGLGILLLYASDESIIDYKSYPADDYIAKPFNLNTLSDKVKSLLSWIPIRKKALGGL